MTNVADLNQQLLWPGLQDISTSVEDQPASSLELSKKIVSSVEESAWSMEEIS